MLDAMLSLRRSSAAILGLILITGLTGCPREKERPARRAPLPRQPFVAKVLAATDGDTLRLRHEGRTLKVRLHAVDAPEKAQPHGRAAWLFVVAKALNKMARVTPKKRDRYERLVAKITIDKKDLGEQLLSAGLAWHYARYDKSERLARLQREARGAKIGLWADPSPTPPWDWRRARRGKKPPKELPRAKGAVHYRGNTHSKVFHHRSCSNFDCRNCRATFSSTGAALKAGYRPHRRCVKHSFRLP